MFVSIHIPKTAGTTIGYILDYGMNRRIFYDYPRYGLGPQHGKVMDAEAKEHDREMILQHKDFIKYKFDIVHGHFHYRKYQDIFPDEKYIVCLRDPVKRTVSHYLHILESGSDKNNYFNEISSGEMGLVEFAELPHIQRVQSLFVEGRDIMDYDHVFLTEKLAETIYQFQLNHNFQRSDAYMNLPGKQSLPNTNPRSARKNKNISFSPAELEKVKQLVAEDQELYQRAIEKCKSQGSLSSFTQKSHGLLARISDYLAR